MSGLDLTNLLEMTSGDTALQHELFHDFMRSGGQFITELRALCDSSDHEAWRAAAHGFKGIAMTLGANDLGELCKQAQDAFAAGADKKQPLLAAINAAFTEVSARLHQHMAA